jgi:hypothetical protein
VNDLAIYSSLQSHINSSHSTVLNVKQLRSHVGKAWAALKSSTIENAFIAKNDVIQKIIEAQGDNGFNVPHHPNP